MHIADTTYVRGYIKKESFINIDKSWNKSAKMLLVTETQWILNGLKYFQIKPLLHIFKAFFQARQYVEWGGMSG